MKANTNLKLVRIPRNAADALTKYITRKNNSDGTMYVTNTGRFIGQAILEKIDREPVTPAK